MKTYEHVPLEFKRMLALEQLVASREFVGRMATRRSVRFISSEPVPRELIENAIRCASLAPSGANQQPWRFVVVKDQEIKRRIREAAEAEERESYEHRMPAEWLEALAPLGTDWHKEFLETFGSTSGLVRVRKARRRRNTTTCRSQSASPPDFFWPPCI
jgi:iodotyrosine deiodinase